VLLKIRFKKMHPSLLSICNFEIKTKIPGFFENLKIFFENYHQKGGGAAI